MVPLLFNRIQTWWDLIRRQPIHNRILMAVLVVGPITVLFLHNSSTPTRQAEPSSVDTFIPAGYVLVPIEIQNSEGLDRVLGSFGVVNLYASESGKRGRLIVRNIKILRSPLDPHSFAVLSPEATAPLILRENQAFHVVIQNPQNSGTQFEKSKSVRKPRIVLE